MLSVRVPTISEINLFDIMVEIIENSMNKLALKGVLSAAVIVA